MNAPKINPDCQPFTLLRTPEAQEFYAEMVVFYEDWAPDAREQLANMANDLALVVACDRAMADADLPPLEMTRLDLRRDRAIKRFNRARQCLNLDTPPVEARPPVPASRYLGAG